MANSPLLYSVPEFMGFIVSPAFISATSERHAVL